MSHPESATFGAEFIDAAPAPVEAAWADASVSGYVYLAYLRQSYATRMIID